MLTKKLEEIGLHEKEAKVYVAALELGQATASEIAKKSGINRATTYFTLENLMKIGLVSASNTEKTQKFTPEDPAQLENIITKQQKELEQKKKDLKNLVSELNKINHASVQKPIVKYYLGKEGIMRMASASFDYTKNKTMRLAFSPDSLNKFLSNEERKKLQNQRVAKGTRIETVYSSKNETLKSKKGIVYKVDNERYQLPGDIAIYDDKIRLTSFKDEIGIIIENKDIAKTLESIFKLAIESAQNKNS